MLIVCSRVCLKVVFLSAQKTKVKRGVVALKAAIADKIDAIKQVARSSFRHPQTGERIEEDIPDTGPGCERWAWPKSAMLDLSAAEAKHLAEGHAAVLDGDGYEPELASGVAEFERALAQWAAPEAPAVASPANRLAGIEEPAANGATA